MRAEELSEEERIEFAESFYDCWCPWSMLGKKPDLSSPEPWGCPWFYDPEVEFKGETVDEMATNYFKEMKLFIIKQIALEVSDYEDEKEEEVKSGVN